MPGLLPGTVWDEASANGLVSQLFALNEKAAASKPDLIVWTETVVPWTYADDDDFVKEITKVTASNNTYSFLGMNSVLTQTAKTLGNSVYMLNPAGKALGRYDKQDLLAMAEKPLFSEHSSLILPFLSNAGLQMHTTENKGPLETPLGKAGVIICNESTNASLVAAQVKAGAEFLINIGNDSWFSDYFITTQHFYNCRLRAVENRKDVVINNNMGICGLVKTNGEVAEQADGKDSDVITADISPNKITPVNSSIFLCVIATILLLASMNLIKSLSTKTSKI
jgi:apolipoprotein N-acyltransferase